MYKNSGYESGSVGENFRISSELVKLVRAKF